MYTTLKAKTQGNQFLPILKLLDPAEFVLIYLKLSTSDHPQAFKWDFIK